MGKPTIKLFVHFQFALLETVTTALLDRFPHWRDKKMYVVLVMCVLGYSGGLPLCTRVCSLCVVGHSGGLPLCTRVCSLCVC